MQADSSSSQRRTENTKQHTGQKMSPPTYYIYFSEVKKTATYRRENVTAEEFSERLYT